MPNLTVHESAEDYLETILILQSRNGLVRSIDIVNEMNFSKPSISIAMKKLREQGYVEMDQNGYISLKPRGREIAERIPGRSCSTARGYFLRQYRKKVTELSG